MIKNNKRLLSKYSFTCVIIIRTNDNNIKIICDNHIRLICTLMACIDYWYKAKVKNLLLFLVLIFFLNMFIYLPVLLIIMVRKSEHTFVKVNITPLGLQILTFLARHPDKQFYIREIAKNMDKSVGGTHKTLKSLKEMNFIIENKSGKNIYYQINQMNPSIKNFKIFMTINELTTLVNNLKKLSEKIILYGSCANGEDTSDSDMDILVLTNEKEKVNKKILNMKFERKIQAIVVNASDLINMKENDKAFYNEVNKGITLWDRNHE